MGTGHFFIIIATFILGFSSAKAQGDDTGTPTLQGDTVPQVPTPPDGHTEGDDTLLSDVFNDILLEQGTEQDQNRHLEIEGYSGLKYEALEKALDARIDTLTDLKIFAITEGPCTINGAPVNSVIWNAKCYSLEFIHNFTKVTLSASNENLFVCGMIIYTHYPERKIVISNCENNTQRINFKPPYIHWRIDPNPVETLLHYDDLDIQPLPPEDDKTIIE